MDVVKMPFGLSNIVKYGCTSPLSRFAEPNPSPDLERGKRGEV